MNIPLSHAREMLASMSPDHPGRVILEGVLASTDAGPIALDVRPASPPPPPRPDDGLNGLERAFWGRLQAARDAKVFEEVYRHAMKVQVVGSRWYTPDFHADGYDRVDGHYEITVFETKGWLREDAELKLLDAASRYHCWRWVLVTRPGRNAWECRDVTRRGISKNIWCPGWLG